MLYKEKEVQMKHSHYWYSFCTDNLGQKYQQWMVPCRILELTPAEFVTLLKDKYHATVSYSTKYHKNGVLLYKWDKQVDEAAWRNYINKKAREKNFQI